MSGYQKIRELCEQAKGEKRRWRQSDYTARLARLLEAALEVVERSEELMAEHREYYDPNPETEAVDAAISSFRSLAEREGGGA